MAEVFDDLEEVMPKEDALGYQEIARRARESVAGLSDGLVFCGFSLGAVHAEVLAASRRGTLGAVLIHSAVPVEELRSSSASSTGLKACRYRCITPQMTPGVEAEEEVVSLGEAVRGAGAAFEAHAYPGSAHLVATWTNASKYVAPMVSAINRKYLRPCRAFCEEERKSHIAPQKFGQEETTPSDPK
jgi:hypothetical protein